MANLYFRGEVDSHWNDKDNWVTDETGNPHPAAPPTSSDDCFIDASSPSACLVDATATCKSLDTTGSSGVTLELGANLTVSGNINFTNLSTFTPSTFLVTINDSGTITSNGKEFYAFTFTPGSGGDTFVLADNMTVNNTLTVTTSNQAIINGNTINAKGNVTDTTAVSFGVNGTTVLNICGSDNQTLTLRGGGVDYEWRLPLTIASTGGTVTFAATSHFILANFTNTSGTFDMTGTTITILGSQSGFSSTNITWNNLQLGKGTVVLSNNATVNGNFTAYNSGTAPVFNGNSIYVKGNVSQQSASQYGISGTTNLYISGTGTQTVDFRGGGSAGYEWGLSIYITNSGTVNFGNYTHWLTGNLTFNGTGTYNLFGTIKYKTGTITYTAGTVDTITNTVTLNITGSCTLNTNGISWYNITWSAVNTTTLNSDLTITGTLTTSGGITTISGAYNINAQGAITIGKELKGDATFLINGTGNQVYTDNGAYLTLDTNIIKASGSMTINGMRFGGNISGKTFTYTSADSTSVTGTWYNGNNVNINLNSMAVNNLTIFDYTTTLTGTLHVNGTLTINSGKVLACGTYDVTCSGNFTNNNGTSGRTGNNTFIFDGTSTLAGATTFYNLTVNPDAIIHLTVSQNFIVSNIATINGTVGHNVIIDSVTPDTKATLKITNGLRNAAYITATDINSSSGKPILGRNLTLDNTTNWANYAAILKRYNGATWETAKCKRYSGSAFVNACPRFYDGDSWEYIETAT